MAKKRRKKTTRKVSKKTTKRKSGSTIVSRAEAQRKRRLQRRKTPLRRRTDPLLGKKYSEARIVELIQKRKVPQMVKHCVLKVKEKLGGGQSNSSTFKGAFNICMNVFQTYGYMYKNAWSKMTFKGIKRNRKHLREASMNVQKNLQFKKLYEDSMKSQIKIYLKEQEQK